MKCIVRYLVVCRYLVPRIECESLESSSQWLSQRIRIANSAEKLFVFVMTSFT